MSPIEAPRHHPPVDWSLYKEHFSFPINAIWFRGQIPTVLSDGRVVVSDGAQRYRYISVHDQREELRSIPHVDIEKEIIISDGTIVTLGHRDGRNTGPFVVRIHRPGNSDQDQVYVEPRFSTDYMFRPSFAMVDEAHQILLADIFGRICRFDPKDGSITLLYHMDGELNRHQDIQYGYDHYYDDLKRGAISPAYSNHCMVTSSEHITRGFEVRNVMPLTGHKVALLRQDSFSDPMVTRQQIVIIDLEKRQRDVVYECIESVLGAGYNIQQMEALPGGSLLLVSREGDVPADTELSFREALGKRDQTPRQIQDITSSMDDAISVMKLRIIRPIHGEYAHCRIMDIRIPEFDTSNPNTRELISILPDGRVALIHSGEDTSTIYIYDMQEEKPQLVHTRSIKGTVHALEVLPDISLACIRTITCDDEDSMEVSLWKS